MRWSILRLIACLVALAIVPAFSIRGQNQPDEKNKSDKAEKKDKKKKKDRGGSEDAYNTQVFSDAVANSVMSDLRDGLEGHSQRLVLSAFDADKMDGYLNFEDQILAMFEKYEGFRVHYRIAQTSVEGARAVILVDMDMEEIPRAGATPPVRKSGQLRFELERGRKGWKIIDFRPRQFFS